MDFKIAQSSRQTTCPKIHHHQIPSLFLTGGVTRRRMLSTLVGDSDGQSGFDEKHAGMKNIVSSLSYISC